MSTPTSDASRGTPRSYLTGFVLSLGLTVAAYLLVVNNALQGSALQLLIAVLAVAQLLVQLVFFLHMGRDSRRRWNVVVLLFALLVVLIVVFGSLWIMQNLNYHMTKSPHETDTHIIKDEGVHY